MAQFQEFGHVERKSMNATALEHFPQPLMTALCELIQQSRQRAVDVAQVHTCWQVGRQIVEFRAGRRGTRGIW